MQDSCFPLSSLCLLCHRSKWTLSFPFFLWRGYFTVSLFYSCPYFMLCCFHWCSYSAFYPWTAPCFMFILSHVLKHTEGYVFVHLVINSCWILCFWVLFHIFPISLLSSLYVVVFSLLFTSLILYFGKTTRLCSLVKFITSDFIKQWYRHWIFMKF